MPEHTPRFTAAASRALQRSQRESFIQELREELFDYIMEAELVDQADHVVIATSLEVRGHTLTQRHLDCIEVVARERGYTTQSALKFSGYHLRISWPE